ncbi:MAG: FkbM family methyltransferase [Oscillospiraceae bacterium]|nr:FkbM family methyltransferase [Oscillospiraceae bacterium]
MFLWEYLKACGKPIVVYGIGNGGDKVFACCQEWGLQVSAVFASDDHATKKTSHDLPVGTYDTVMERYPDGVILVAFGTYDMEIVQRIRQMGQNHAVFVPDVPLFGGSIFTREYLAANELDIQKARSLFSDEWSCNVFGAMLRAKCSGRLEDYLSADTPRSEDLKLLNLGDKEAYLDLGAYNGDTIEEFLNLTEGHYASITAFEPNAQNYRKLQTYAASKENLLLYPFASWNEPAVLTFSGKGGRMCAKVPELPGQYKHLHEVEAIPVDSLSEDFTFVKMDVEGAERETLLGMQETIKRCHPKLLISCYHRTDDFIRLPLLLEELCPGYRMYLRRNPCIPAWEIQLYAIYPEET